MLIPLFKISYNIPLFYRKLAAVLYMPLIYVIPPVYAPGSEAIS